MSKGNVQIVILCEDRQQEVFARYFLKKRGFTGRLIRSKICPPGSQAGEQYVRTQYPVEVKAYRQKKNRVSIGLVVLIDADTGTLEARLNQLASVLAQDAQENRRSNEAIAIFVPKRNIETWIHYLQHYLQGETVNEEAVYAKFEKNEAVCKTAVEDLADRCYSQSLPEDAPRSLQAACGELQRLLPLLQP